MNYVTNNMNDLVCLLKFGKLADRAYMEGTYFNLYFIKSKKKVVRNHNVYCFLIQNQNLDLK